MKNNVLIPSFLHDIHGERSNWFDLIATHTLAIATILATLAMVDMDTFPNWKIGLLLLLAYDLGGGVIANFTYGTKHYYDQSPRRRYFFLTLHILQPLVMMIVFFEHTAAIELIGIYTLAAAFGVNSITNPQRQVIIGVLLAILGMIGLFVLPFNLPTLLQLFLSLYLLKLPLSFAVRWYRLENFGVPNHRPQASHTS